MFSHSWSQFGKALKSLCIPSHLCSIFFKSSVFSDLKPAGYPFQRAQFTCLSESHLILSQRVLGSKPHSADFFFSLLSSSRKECWKPYTPHLPLPLVSQEVEHAPLSLSLLSLFPSLLSLSPSLLCSLSIYLLILLQFISLKHSNVVYMTSIPINILKREAVLLTILCMDRS